MLLREMLSVYCDRRNTYMQFARKVQDLYMLKPVARGTFRVDW